MQKSKRYINLILNLNASLESKQNIFIVSHMRSCSTLLSHVLSTHPQICGHRELHSSYTRRIHFLKTRASLFRERESFVQADYLLDKMLHCKLSIDERIFKRKPKYIFLLREPETTMVSMIKMHLSHKNTKQSIYKLEEYYVNRMIYMKEYWNKLEGDKIFVSSEMLTDKTQNTLSKISRFLNLSTPLSDKYELYTDTGKHGVGDFSSNIKSGRILKPTPLTSDSKALLSLLNMDKINNAYEDTINFISP
ncbi:sulfotransferase family protein [Vibrio alfacsensis]|uniref:sulfotransferase family protein n=1 Tax=Vibrio alfacsensis TaxID=1074311 RepID=UPI00406883C3